MFNDELDALRSQGLYRVLRPLEGGQGPRIRIDGREVISLASNDYLGLASHPVLTAAAMEATERYGTGSGASRLLSGSQPLHHDLEEDLARFLGCEAALVFNSGHGANTGVLAALCGPGDLIISDALNHASIVDGCRLSKAEKRIYKHRNLNDLEDMLKVSNEYKRRWIVTDSVFSMDGDMAPLPGIVELAERYGAFVYVDEAHATGVVGPQGRGSTAHFRLAERITLRMGTLGKALGSFGAFVAGDRDIIDLLINRARPFIYSTSLPPSVLAASRAAVALIQTAE
ncbi:MAG: 8-amino-7-oxononanoate synthase, partial [bacterium]|nr:8-amino-7-oxononanoate synthase [bacterium]